MKLRKINYLELKIYRLLGVRLFQKMVFSLEKFIHRKDGGTNQNYHFDKKMTSTLTAFNKYLFWNASIHIRNAVFLALIFTVKFTLKRFYWIDFVLYLLFVKDLYCIMLQRYNYLRICKASELTERYRENKIMQKSKQYSETISGQFTKPEQERMLKLVQKMIKGLDNNEIVFISKDEEQQLKQIIGIIKMDVAEITD